MRDLLDILLLAALVVFGICLRAWFAPRRR